MAITASENMIEFFGAIMSEGTAVVLIGEAAVAAVIVVAFVLARLHKGKYHHWLMLTAFASDFLVFKMIMAVKLVDGNYGTFPWDIHWAILPHVLAAVATTVFAIGAILLAFKHYTKKDGKMLLPPKGRKHRWLGRLFIISWWASTVLGYVIFFKFYVG